ncbi:hypothetical protein FQR65_LT04281 [Abscondita terminalis]|nr:hypothetical protein FQR65_LT04281 [Abscondita terminalis]
MPDGVHQVYPDNLSIVVTSRNSDELRINSEAIHLVTILPNSIMEEEFIHRVMQHPFLYNKSENDFKNTQKKELYWKQIGKECNISGDAAQKLFKSLREKYVRIKRENEKLQRSGAGGSIKSKWALFDLLKFLDDVIKPRNTISNILKPSTSQAIQPEDALSVQSVYEEELYLSDVEIVREESPAFERETMEYRVNDIDQPVSRVNTPVAHRKRKISSNIDDKIGTALDAITKSLTQDVSSPETNVNIKSFCTYMEQEMLQMPPEVVEEFKDDVTTLLLQSLYTYTTWLISVSLFVIDIENEKLSQSCSIASACAAGNELGSFESDLFNLMLNFSKQCAPKHIALVIISL